MVIPQVLDKNRLLYLILTRFFHVSAMVTNNNRNAKNRMSNGYSSSIRRESIAFFDFKLIPLSSAKVTDIKTTQLLWILLKFPPKVLAFHREPIHSYLS